MREITKHLPGKIFIFILLLSLIFAILILPFIFAPNAVLFGWMTVPLLSGATLMLVWLGAIAIYVNFFWPYR
ncbi:hypothetical protein LR013_02800 [candidate division NPL-UPA2 bacterium]|nr:hypothetical protein [candidate division NPL-UPA2 bacterium]